MSVAIKREPFLNIFCLIEMKESVLKIDLRLGGWGQGSTEEAGSQHLILKPNSTFVPLWRLIGDLLVFEALGHFVSGILHLFFFQHLLIYSMISLEQ